MFYFGSKKFWYLSYLYAALLTAVNAVRLTHCTHLLPTHITYKETKRLAISTSISSYSKLFLATQKSKLSLSIKMFLFFIFLIFKEVSFLIPPLPPKKNKHTHKTKNKLWPSLRKVSFIYL